MSSAGFDDRFFVGPDSDPDRFEILETRGSGGEGVVTKARFQLDGTWQIVAVKTLLPDRSPDLGPWTDRWRSQVDLLRLLADPGIVGVHDGFLGPVSHRLGQSEGRPRTLHLVMNWVEGTNLARWRDALSADSSYHEITGVLSQIARSLDYLASGQDTNGQTVVHGDLKPGNVIVTPGGQTRLVDFGLARLAHAQPIETYGGTPGYLAPEVISTGRYTPAADRFALGAVAYFLFTGEDPPGHYDPARLRASLLASPVLRDRPDVADIVLQAMAADPASRPAAGEWARQLELTSSTFLRGAAGPAGAGAVGGAVAGGAIGAVAGGAVAGAAGPSSGATPPPQAAPGGPGTPWYTEPSSAPSSAPAPPPPPPHPVARPTVISSPTPPGTPAGPPPPPAAPPFPPTGAEPTTAVPTTAVPAAPPPVGPPVGGTPPPPGPVIGPDPSSGSSPGARPRKRRRAVFAGLAVLILLAGALAAFLLTRGSDDELVDTEDTTTTTTIKRTTTTTERPTTTTERPELTTTTTTTVDRSVGGLTYLSDMTALDDSDYYRFETGPGTVSGQIYTRSVLLDPYAERPGYVEYDLGRRYKTLSGTVGLSDAVPSDTVMRVEIYADGTPLFNQDLRLGQAVPIELDMANVLRLRLQVTDLRSQTSTDADAVFGDMSLG